MSKKGGYRILDFKDFFFDTGVSQVIEGIHDYIVTLKDKVTLISGLNIDDVYQDDMFVSWVEDQGAYKATIGAQTIIIGADDSVEIVDGIIGGGGEPGPVEIDASDVSFDPTGTGLESTDVQGALEEVKDAIDEVKGLIPEDFRIRFRNYTSHDNFLANFTNVGDLYIISSERYDIDSIPSGAVGEPIPNIYPATLDFKLVGTASIDLVMSRDYQASNNLWRGHALWYTVDGGYQYMFDVEVTINYYGTLFIASPDLTLRFVCISKTVLT